MADTYQVNIEALINLTGRNLEISTAVVTGTPSYSAQAFILQSGDNSFTVPAGAKNLIIIPNLTNAHTYKLKGVGGDTGVVVMADFSPILLNVVPAATFIVNSSGLDTLPTSFIWF